MMEWIAMPKINVVAAFLSFLSPSHAVSITMTSRYSSRVLRLTYSRSLPVLATLFLLSYTGILRTVSTVLFSYSAITHLPGGHQQIVWSVDASVQLFNLKFFVLAICYMSCIVLTTDSVQYHYYLQDT